MSGRPNDLDGAAGMNRDGLGYAAHEETIQAAEPVRTQDDQVGLPGLCLV